MKMKKIVMFVAIVATIISGTAIAALIGTQRIGDNFWFLDDKQVQFGNLPDAAVEYDTAQTNDSLVIGVPATNDRLVITRKADMSVNFGLSDLNSAGLTAMSNGGDKAVTLYHDDTNAVIAISSGVLSIPAGISVGAGVIGGGAGTFTSLDVTDGNITNVGNIALDSLEADAAAGTITMKGATAGVNKENLVWDFETTPNVVGVSSGTGASLVNFGAISLGVGGLDVSDGNIANVGYLKLDSIYSDEATGQIVIGGATGPANNEALTLDFEAVANTVSVSSTTGVTLVDVGAIGLAGGSLDVSDGNITNAGSVGVDSINADGTTVDYNDVNILELPQADLGVNCTLGQIAIDTAATVELCYCKAENSWYCQPLTAGPTD